MSLPLPAQLKIHRSIRDIPREAWNALLSEDSTPFVDHRYLTAMEESGASGWHPRHLGVWQGNRLVAAAPAYVKEDSLGEFVFDGAWATAAERIRFAWYPKLVIGLPFTPVTGPRLLVARGEDVAARRGQLVRGAIEYARKERFSSIHVHFHTEGEVQPFETEGFASRYGVQYHWRNQGYATPADFLERFRSDRRTQIKRERRAVADAGIALRTLRGEEVVALDAAEISTLYDRTVDRNFGERFLSADFFRALLRDMPEHVEFVEARKDGRRIAGAFNLASKSTLYGRYWGSFEEQPFLHFNVCLYHPVDECIARGVQRFEPGAGGEHKLTRGFPPVLTYSSHLVFHPALDSAVRQYLTAERAAILSGLPSWHADSGLKSPERG